MLLETPATPLRRIPPDLSKNAKYARARYSKKSVAGNFMIGVSFAICHFVSRLNMTSTTPFIRPYQPADAAALPQLLAELGYEVTLPEVEERTARLLNSPGQAIFVVEVFGKIIGCAHVQERPALHTPRAAELTALVVAQDQRRGGYGRMLVQATEDWARTRGCGLILLRSRVQREDAHRFYENLGYSNQSTSYKFIKRLR
jgi:GNAT superfamily N-acetyltransferase